MLGLVEVRNILQSITSQTDNQGVSEWVSVCVEGVENAAWFRNNREFHTPQGTKGHMHVL